MRWFAEILLAVTGTVALQVVAQAVLIASVRFIGHRTQGAGELRRTFWISLGAVVPLLFGHLAQAGLWAGFLVWLGALQSYDDAFYFSLRKFHKHAVAGGLDDPAVVFADFRIEELAAQRFEKPGSGGVQTGAVPVKGGGIELAPNLSVDYRSLETTW